MPKAKNTSATAPHATTPTTSPALTPSALTANRLLRRPEVESLTGLCCSAIYAGMKRGTFPRPIPLGARAVGWRARDIEAFLEHGVAGVRNDSK